jgi:excisionase family DNA binding protein
MTDSAEIRRSDSLCRIFHSRPYHRLGATRRPSERLAYLGYMSDFEHLGPGLEPVLTTSELASHLGVPVQTIHDLRHSGRGPRGFRVGRELRYRVPEVHDWLSNLEEASERRPTRNGSDR